MTANSPQQPEEQTSTVRALHEVAPHEVTAPHGVTVPGGPAGPPGRIPAQPARGGLPLRSG